MTIVIGSWIVPVLLSLLAAAYYGHLIRRDTRQPGGDYSAIGNGVVAFVWSVIAIIVLLSIWLAYAVYYINVEA